MALNITTPINTFEGITLQQSYARVVATDDYKGTSLTTFILFYPSKVVYQSGAQPLNVKKNNDYSLLNPINTTMIVPYNREIEGSDVLQLAHDAWIAYLGTLGITAVEDLSVSL